MDLILILKYEAKWISSFRFIPEFPSVVVAVDPVLHIFFFVVPFLEFFVEDFLLEWASLFFSLIFLASFLSLCRLANIFRSDWQVLLFLFKVLLVLFSLRSFISRIGKYTYRASFFWIFFWIYCWLTFFWISWRLYFLVVRLTSKGFLILLLMLLVFEVI